MVGFQRLALSLGLCLRVVAAFKIYNASDLEDRNVGDACVKAMSADIACHEHIHSFMQPRYRGSLHNVTLTDQICTGTCSASLRSWFNTVVDSGWNETYIKDPKTKNYCNDIISEFTELKDGKEMPRDELCHIYYRCRLAIMQLLSYSIYNHFYQSQLEKVYKTCSGSGLTEMPPPPKVEKPKEYYLINKYYTTKEGDTCDLIARANLGVAGVYLYIGNQELIGDYRDIPAGIKLCLPTICPIYVVKPGDTCWSIKQLLKVIEDTIEYYNSWINIDYTNLQKATDFYGKPICIGPFGAGSRSASSDANPTIKDDYSGIQVSRAYYVEVNFRSPPEDNPPKITTTKNAKPEPTKDIKPSPTQDGLIESCTAFYMAKKGDTYNKIVAQYKTFDFDDFFKWNPAVDKDSKPTTTKPANGIITPLPIQDSIVKNCEKFHQIKSTTTCTSIENYYNLPLSTFLSWNPAVGKDCTSLLVNYWAATTTKGSSNGIKMPPPMQAGMVSNCNKFHTVKKTITCASIQDYYKISLADFIKWNPTVGKECKGLWADYNVCVGVIGGIPTKPGNGVETPSPIQAGLVSNCKKFHQVQSTTTCASIQKYYSISLAQLVMWNPAIGSKCIALWVKYWLPYR
ncbi:uncharacterized protein FRV6_14329 [Fusarium oxysporum]|uniref:LysM domain-containing protein n=1 Tax=Fusarium oxysporum TaxID=5507 RepID=A0A2H3TWU2_FUSOX|nr:uncharacterized protein FRV6_14329 [Fusarium oxysporum]